MKYKIIKNNEIIYSLNKTLIDTDLRSKGLNDTMIQEVNKIVRVKPDEKEKPPFLSKWLLDKIYGNPHF